MTMKVCSSCGKNSKLIDFYSSSSYFNRFSKKVSVCKECLVDYVEPKNGKNFDMNKVKEALRMIDKPFIKSLWESAINESENRGTHIFRAYMKNIGMKDFRDLNWSDSDFNENKNQSNEYEFDDFEEEIVIGKEEIRYWGKGYALEDYEFLENEKMKLMSSFECPDYGMEMIMKDIAFLNLDIEKVRLDGKETNHRVLTNLIDTRSKLMNAANMQPIQATGSEANDQITFGTLIRKWENERPVPKPLEDEMKEYIDLYMVGHLAKMQGLNNDFTKKYDEELAKYAVNKDERNSDEEEWDD